ncbi:MAG: MarR family transcriptional regulator [Proteobacteria bacterium]|nr:MarR family transcriptional regulator [Pseudomonadota bacterium]
MGNVDAKNELRDDYTEKIILALRYLAQISSMYSKYLEKEVSVTTGQLLCLRALSKEDSLSLGEIARRIFLKPGTLTGLVDRLEAKGMVQRTRIESDRRSIRLKITEKGRQLVEEAPIPIQSLIAMQLKRMPVKEVETISNGMMRLLEIIQQAEIIPEDQAMGIDAPAY